MNFKIFIINLDRSLERYKLAAAQFSPWPDLPIERVSAAEGKLLSPNEIQQFYSLSLNTKKYHKLLNVAEIGCFISHIRCWQKIVDEKLDFALILEDDFVLQGDIEALVQDITQLQTTWHYLKLASPYKPKKALAKIALKNHDLVFFQKMPVSTIAQAVSATGAKLLLENAKAFYMPVDVFIQHSWLSGVEALGLQPYCFDANHALESQIQVKKKIRSNRFLFFKNRIVFSLKNYFVNKQRLSLFIKKFSVNKQAKF